MIGPIEWQQGCYSTEPTDSRNEQPHVGQRIPAPLQEEHRDGDAGQMLCTLV